MPDEFRTLAATVRGMRSHELQAPPSAAPVEEPDLRMEHAGIGEESEARMDALRELRVFRARIVEGVNDAVETVLADIAAEVLARELQSAPADIQRIVDRALQRYLAEEPLCVRVHRDEKFGLSCGVPVVSDDRLRTGDVVIELRSGYVEATLGARLADVLAAISE